MDHQREDPGADRHVTGRTSWRQYRWGWELPGRVVGAAGWLESAAGILTAARSANVLAASVRRILVFSRLILAFPAWVLSQVSPALNEPRCRTGIMELRAEAFVVREDAYPGDSCFSGYVPPPSGSGAGRNSMRTGTG